MMKLIVMICLILTNRENGLWFFDCLCGVWFELQTAIARRRCLGRKNFLRANLVELQMMNH